MPPERAKKHSPAPQATAGFNEAESPIAWLRRRKDRDGEAMLSQPQFDAGERLRADFWFAQMTPRTTMNWSAVSPIQRRRRAGAPLRSDADLRDDVAAAGDRVRRALTAVGPELAGVLIDVCCHLKGLEEAERAAGWPQRSGKIVLHLALTALARHYGLLGTGSATPQRPAVVRHWGASDYRPHFELPEEGDGA
jgi:hypothetical protein